MLEAAKNQLCGFPMDSPEYKTLARAINRMESQMMRYAEADWKSPLHLGTRARQFNMYLYKEYQFFKVLLDAMPPAGLVQPPRNLELVFHLLMSPETCDCALGDLEERYRKLAIRLGRRRANIWYGKQVLHSALPLLKEFVRARRSSAVITLLVFALRLGGLGKLANELQQIAQRQRRRGRPAD